MLLSKIFNHSVAAVVSAVLFFGCVIGSTAYYRYHGAYECQYDAKHAEEKPAATINSEERNANEPQPNASEHEPERETCFWSHTAEQWLALLTAWLVLGTALLAVFTAFLWLEARESSARGMRPRFALKGEPSLDNDAQSGVTFSNADQLPERVRLVIWYEDVGGTAAETVYFRFGWTVADGLPSKPRYRRVIWRPPPQKTGNPRILDPRRVLGTEFPLSPGQRRAIFDERKTLWVYCELKFLGIDRSQPFYVRYCGKWVGPKEHAKKHREGFATDWSAPRAYRDRPKNEKPEKDPS